MRQQRVAQAVAGKGVLKVSVGGLVQRPVFPQLTGTKHEHALVAQLKILDDGQGGVGFAQAHAVGQDAAAMRAQLGDDTARAVFLKLVKGIPNPGVGEPGGNQVVVAGLHRLNVLAEQFVQRFVIDPFRGIVLADAGQRVQHPLLHILRAPPVVPQAVEPFPQFGKGGGVGGGQVDFQIGPVAAAQPAPGEIGAADDAGAAVRPVGKV